jgi:hypothetical protein
MDEKTRNVLKSYFENGDRPDEKQFNEFIDSMINKLDDGIYILHPEKFVGIGVKNPKEKLDIAGGIRIGDSSGIFPGVIRWTGNDFEGYDGKEWISLTKDKTANRSVFIPEPRIECTADNLYIYWDDCTDKQFLNYKPSYWLYRYKSRIKKTFKNKAVKSKIKSKRWAHPEHRDSTSHNNPRNTEFNVNIQPGLKQLLDMQPAKWFKPIPNDKVNKYFIPRGQGMYPVPQNPHFNRRFEYFRIRIVIRIGDQYEYGPFSEVFSLGHRRIYTKNKNLKVYKPVFEMVHPGNGMCRKTVNS